MLSELLLRRLFAGLQAAVLGTHPTPQSTWGKVSSWLIKTFGIFVYAVFILAFIDAFILILSRKLRL